MDYYIFGLQRSGTNFLQKLIFCNFHARKVNAKEGAWKHSIVDPPKYDKSLPTIIIYKNPYTWVESVSMRNNVDWIETQNKYPVNEQIREALKVGPKNMNLRNLCMTYSSFHNNWLRRNDINKYLIIKYEDLLDPEKRSEVLAKIEDRFGFQRKTRGKWVIPERGDVSQSKDYDEEREKYYLECKPKYLTSRQINEVNRIVGAKRIMRMGYKILK